MLFHRVFFFFLIIDLYFLFPAAITQIFNPIAEFVVQIGKPSKEAKTEIEIHPVNADDKIRMCSKSFTNTLLANGFNTFFIKHKPAFSNDPKNLPRIPPDCSIF